MDTEAKKRRTRARKNGGEKKIPDPRIALQKRVLALNKGYTSKQIRYKLTRDGEDELWECRLDVGGVMFYNSEGRHSKRAAKRFAAEMALHDWRHGLRKMLIAGGPVPLWSDDDEATPFDAESLRLVTAIGAAMQLMHQATALLEDATRDHRQLRGEDTSTAATGAEIDAYWMKKLSRNDARFLAKFEGRDSLH